MKGVPGLLIAVALAVTGGLCNWFYMSQKARELDLVQFIGVAEAGIKSGDIIQQGQLQPIAIPLRYAQRLKSSAPLWQDLATVVGTTAYRDFQGGDLMLLQDLRTLPGNDLKRDLGPDEVAIWITVDSRGFVPQFFSGGDEVSFIVASTGSTVTPANPAGPLGQQTEVIGPFYVLALGNRRGSSDRARASGISSSSENVVAIRVKKTGDQLEPQAQDLLARLKFSGNQALGMVMHAERKK